jgi:chromosome partitioning protein
MPFRYRDRNISPLGIIATKYQANSTVHNNMIRQLKGDEKLPPVYETKIKQTNVMAAAAEFMRF